MNLIALQDKAELMGSPIYAGEGEAFSPTVTFWATVSATGATHTAYRGKTDASATVLSGSLSAASNILTLKAIGNEVGGYTYRHFVKVNIGGEYFIRYFDRIIARKAGPRLTYR